MAAVTTVAATTMLLIMQRPQESRLRLAHSRKAPFASLAQSCSNYAAASAEWTAHRCSS